MAPMNENTVIDGSDIVDGEGGLYLTIRDEAFELRRVSINYQMMKFAVARRNADVHVPEHLPEKDPRRVKAEEKRNAAGMEIMALLLDATNILLKPHERDRFDQFMTELSMSDEGLKPGELEEAIGAAMAAVGGAEEKGKAPVNTSSDSSPGSENTKPNVRVISSRKVTPEDGLPRVNQFAHDAT